MSTVLVIGAGVSNDYGLPIGSELRKKLIDPELAGVLTDLKVQSDQFMRGHGPNDARVAQIRHNFEEFQGVFAKSALPTIDAFLDKRKQYGEQARIAIAWILLRAEAKALRRYDLNHGPYPLIAEKLRDSVHQLDAAGLKIVTFNYDRTLQALVAAILKNQLGHSSPDGLFGDLSLLIKHVYGSLTTPIIYDEQSHQFAHGRRGGYGLAPELPPAEYIEACKSISMIGAERTDGVQSPFPAIRSMIAGAKKLIFLGFGFDNQNLAQLGIAGGSNALSGREVHATCIGLTARQQKEAQVAIGTRVNFGDGDSVALLNSIDF